MDGWMIPKRQVTSRQNIPPAACAAASAYKFPFSPWAVEAPQTSSTCNLPPPLHLVCYYSAASRGVLWRALLNARYAHVYMQLMSGQKLDSRTSVSLFFFGSVVFFLG